MDYEKKYIKYKMKYNEFKKKLVGGSPRFKITGPITANFYQNIIVGENDVRNILIFGDVHYTTIPHVGDELITNRSNDIYELFKEYQYTEEKGSLIKKIGNPENFNKIVENATIYHENVSEFYNIMFEIISDTGKEAGILFESYHYTIGKMNDILNTINEMEKIYSKSGKMKQFDGHMNLAAMFPHMKISFEKICDHCANDFFSKRLKFNMLCRDKKEAIMQIYSEMWKYNKFFYWCNTAFPLVDYDRVTFILIEYKKQINKGVLTYIETHPIAESSTIINMYSKIEIYIDSVLNFLRIINHSKIPTLAQKFYMHTNDFIEPYLRIPQKLHEQIKVSIQEYKTSNNLLISDYIWMLGNNSGECVDLYIEAPKSYSYDGIISEFPIMMEEKNSAMRLVTIMFTMCRPHISKCDLFFSSMRKHNANTRLYTTNEDEKKYYLNFIYTLNNLIENNIGLLQFFNDYVDYIIGLRYDNNTYNKYYLRWDDDKYSASYQDISDYNDILVKQYRKSIFLLNNRFCLQKVLHKVNEIMQYEFSDTDTEYLKFESLTFNLYNLFRMFIRKFEWDKKKRETNVPIKCQQLNYPKNIVSYSGNNHAKWFNIFIEIYFSLPLEHRSYEETTNIEANSIIHNLVVTKIDEIYNTKIRMNMDKYNYKGNNRFVEVESLPFYDMIKSYFI
jgi:hypothetical protein